jgi:hypothetical protein
LVDQFLNLKLKEQTIMTKQLFILSMLATSSLLTGCSTLTAGGTSQNVAVFTATPEGKDVRS